LFDADEVAIFLADAGAGETMTAGDVAHVYGWKPETVSHWCSSGFLEAKKGRRGGVAAWHISHAALAEFTRTYSVVSDLAKSTDASSRTILKKLTESGVQTCGAKAVGTTTRGHLVRIADLLELI
jgi:ABC-type proline/glycine betaine transport system substrate-binding protein